MSFLKGAVLALIAVSVPAMADTAYVVPADVDASTKVVVRVDQSGVAEFQKADGSWEAGQAVQIADQAHAFVQKAFWYDNGGGCNCGSQPYYQNGYMYGQPYYGAPAVRVRKYETQRVYEYDSVPTPPPPPVYVAPPPAYYPPNYAPGYYPPSYPPNYYGN